MISLDYLIDKVAFQSIHDEVVTGYFAYQKDEGSQSHPSVILLHGNNGFQGTNHIWGNRWLDTLARAGYCVLAIDSYGFGERLVPHKPEFSFFTIGPYEFREMITQHVVDVRRTIDFLYTRSEVDTTRIAVMGESMGSWQATLVAGLENRLKTAVLVVGGASQWRTDDPFYGASHTLNFASRIRIPILMVNATKDEYKEPGLAEELFAALSEPKKLVWHDSEHVILVEDQQKSIMPWFKEHLK